MAKQNRPIIWEVTIGIISFYKRCGVGCVRMKSNLTAKRWRTDPAFEGSRLSAACMALSSQLASSFYQTIPQEQRYYPHYKQLVGMAQHMLCQGYNIQQVNKVLHFAVSRYLRKLHAADPNRKPERSPFAATFSLKVKPVFTTAMPHQQLVAPQFTTITISRAASRLWSVITTGKSAFSLWPVIIPPRGSPTVITGYIHKTEILPATTCHLSGSTPVEASHTQWQGLLCSIPTNTAISLPKQHSKHHKNIPRKHFSTPNLMIAA